MYIKWAGFFFINFQMFEVLFLIKQHCVFCMYRKVSRFSLNHIRKEQKEGRQYSYGLKSRLKSFQTKYRFLSFSAKNICLGFHSGPFWNTKVNLNDLNYLFTQVSVFNTGYQSRVKRKSLRVSDLTHAVQQVLFTQHSCMYVDAIKKFFKKSHSEGPLQ